MAVLSVFSHKIGLGPSGVKVQHLYKNLGIRNETYAKMRGDEINSIEKVTILAWRESK